MKKREKITSTSHKKMASFFWNNSFQPMAGLPFMSVAGLRDTVHSY